MKLSAFGLVLVAGLAVAGCQPTKEQLAMESNQDDAQCRSMGAQPRTDTMVQCRLALYQNREREKARAREAIGALGEAMMIAGSQPRYVAPSTSITCTTFLNTTHCN